MINTTEEPHYIARHRRGGYLTRDWVWPEGARFGANIWHKGTDPVPAMRFSTVEHAKDWLAENGMTGFMLTIAPVCACCGEPRIVRHPAGHFSPYRCDKHADRNPCAIEGCRRTAEAPRLADGTPRLANNQVLCLQHWKRYVPARSLLRRSYNQFWRTAKRQATPECPDGWTDELHDRFVRFWRALIRRARRRSAQGFVDEAEIAKLMGWDTT